MRHHLLIILSLLILSSCSKEKVSYRVGLSQCSEDVWRETLNNEIKLESSLYGDIELIISSVKDDSEQQIKAIENFIKQKVDLLIISPNESQALTPIVSKAYDSGIPIILVDRKTDNDKYTAFVGGDNHQIGAQAANYLVSNVPDQIIRNVFVVRGYKGATADTERYEGFTKALPTHINIAGEVYCNFLEDNAKSTFLSLLILGAIPNRLDAIFAFNDAMAMGVYSAYEEYRQTTGSNIKTPLLIGVDALWGTNGGQEAIQNGIIDASFVYPTGGAKIMELAHKILNKEAVDKENLLNTMAVNSLNIKTLQLQAIQLHEQQTKLDKLNEVLTASTNKFIVQQRTTFALLVLVVLCFGLIFTLSYLNRQKKALNTKLSSQNDMISKQIEELESQKKQLIDISNKLEETTQAKLAFFTNISHEFKTPLSLITGPVRDVLADKSLSIANREHLEIVYRNTSKLERLIAELLDFRSIESNQMIVSYSMGNLSFFFQRILSMFEDVIKRRQLTFSYSDSYATGGG